MPDVIFLQETYSTQNVEAIWKSEWRGSIIYSHGTTHSKGVAILFNPKLDVRIGSSEADENGRYLLLEASIFESTFLFSNIYSPNDNNSQNTNFSKLSDSLRRHADLQIVIAPLDKNWRNFN